MKVYSGVLFLTSYEIGSDYKIQVVMSQLKNHELTHIIKIESDPENYFTILDIEEFYPDLFNYVYRQPNESFTLAEKFNKVAIYAKLNFSPCKIIYRV